MTEKTVKCQVIANRWVFDGKTHKLGATVNVPPSVLEGAPRALRVVARPAATPAPEGVKTTEPVSPPEPTPDEAMAAPGTESEPAPEEPAKAAEAGEGAEVADKNAAGVCAACNNRHRGGDPYEMDSGAGRKAFENHRAKCTG